MNSILKRDILSVAESADVPWDKLYGKTLLITGATGFIGSFMIYALINHALNNNKQINIIALVRNRQKAESMFADYLTSGMISFCEQDVCEKITLDTRADYIVHCASNAAPKEYSAYPVETMKTNFYGTLNLLEYSKRVEAESFLYVSTIEIYGAINGDGLINEDDSGYIDSAKVRSCYPLSKKACETLAISYADEYGVDVKIGRLSYIFGPGMKPGDSKIVAVFPKCIANNENIVMKSKGEQLRSYTYITDAVTGLLTVLLKGVNGEAYNIASKLCTTTIAGIAETLVSLCPEKGLTVKYELPSETELKRFSLIQNAVLSPEKLEALGWKPRVDLKTGLKNTVEEQSEIKKCFEE